MKAAIQPIPFNLFPGIAYGNRIEVETQNWSKNTAGVFVSYSIWSVELRDWVEQSTQEVTTIDAETGAEVVTTHPVEITTQREHVVLRDTRTAKLTQEQWDNWPQGDSTVDDAYLLACVLENTGIQPA